MQFSRVSHIHALDFLHLVVGFVLDQLREEQLDALRHDTPLFVGACGNDVLPRLDDCWFESRLTTDVVVGYLSSSVGSDSRGATDGADTLIDLGQVGVHTTIVELVHHLDHRHIQVVNDRGPTFVVVQVKKVLDSEGCLVGLRHAIRSDNGRAWVLQEGLHQVRVNLGDDTASIDNRADRGLVKSERARERGGGCERCNEESAKESNNSHF